MTKAVLEPRRNDNSHRLCLSYTVSGQRLVFPLETGPNLIGADPSNHLVLKIEGVSQFHALILFDGETLDVADQESKNGTFVNGSRIRRCRATLGDELWIGPVELDVEAVASDDTELAIRIPVVEGLGTTDAGSLRSTQSVWHRGRSPGDSWAEAVRMLIDVLSSDQTAQSGSGLEEVLHSLGIAGLSILELQEGKSPVSLFWFGEVEPALLRTVQSRWTVSPRQDQFRSDKRVTTFIRAGGDPAVAIAVAGDFHHRATSQPLLMTLLSIHQLGQLAPLHHSQPTASPRSTSVVFPTDYVVGLSAASQGLHSEIQELAEAHLPVLICGETGVGKEMIARTLHLSSDRREGPFVALNCSAIPADLLEAELFGIGKGVATGVSARVGLFQKAQGGTLLLDEIGEMPIALQAKLLRALEEQEVTPLGAAPLSLDVRVLAATNAEIEHQIEEGRFRRDFFYRIAGAVLRVQPLRDRRPDIPLLVDRFLRDQVRETGKSVRGLSVAAQGALTSYDWPGNVREVKHEVQRLVHACPPGQAITFSHLAETIRRAASAHEGDTVEEKADRISKDPPTPCALPTLHLGELERLAIVEALRQSGGHRANAAELLGLSRFALQRRLRQDR